MMQLVHGGDWAGYRAQYGQDALDFSANVSPLGLPEGVAKAITAALATADRYPDPLCRALRAKLAVHEKVPMEHILCGNGAADLIFRLVWAAKPRTALLPAPTFAEYAAALETAGCTVRRHFLQEKEDFAVIEAFVSAVDEDTDMVFLCQPNNPTGQLTPLPLVEALLRRCERCGALLVVDECFLDFLPESEALSAKKLLASPHLIILKAFTKLYGMAGVRLGYCLCSNTALLEKMQTAGQPWAVSSLAQAAGLAALDETAYVARVQTLIAQQRPVLRDGLRALGLRVVSIYMGGGTPTTLNAAQLDRLCTALEREFDLGALREYTVEAGRPDTITEDKLRVLRAHGVDRVHDLLIRLHRRTPYSDISSAASAALDNIALLGREAGGDDVINLARHAAEGLGKLIPLYFGGAAALEHIHQQPRYSVAQAHNTTSLLYFDFDFL